MTSNMKPILLTAAIAAVLSGPGSAFAWTTITPPPPSTTGTTTIVPNTTTPPPPSTTGTTTPPTDTTTTTTGDRAPVVGHTGDHDGGMGDREMEVRPHTFTTECNSDTQGLMNWNATDGQMELCDGNVWAAVMDDQHTTMTQIMATLCALSESSGMDTPPFCH